MPRLWSEYEALAGAESLPPLSFEDGINPFADWGIEQRYAHDRFEPGFGEGLDERHPDRDVLPALLERASGDRRLVWRAIVLRAVEQAVEPGAASTASWPDWVARVRNEPDRARGALRRLDTRLADEGRKVLVLADALDRTSSVRDESAKWLAGVLEAALDLRATKAIRLKVFARPDMLEHPVVRGFPDASKSAALAAGPARGSSRGASSHGRTSRRARHRAGGVRAEASRRSRPLVMEHGAPDGGPGSLGGHRLALTPSRGSGTTRRRRGWTRRSAGSSRPARGGFFRSRSTQA
ncbi:MAG: hypothetical protein OHK0013_09130 [Sandaracinaceae bacterium]